MKKGFQQTIKHLREEYARELPAKLAKINDLWQTLQRRWNVEKLVEMHRDIHKLAGNSAAFGFTALGETARPLESFILEIKDRQTTPSQAEIANINRGLAALAAAADRPDSPEEELFSPEGIQAPSLIYVVEDDLELARYLAAELEQRGHEVRIFTTLEGLPQAMEEKIPAALLVDVMLTEGELAGPRGIFKLQQRRKQHLPVIFISSRSDMAARLAAVRANGDAYFTKPFDLEALSDKLSELLHPGPRRTQRALIVDDSRQYADRYAPVLRQIGLQVKNLANPMRILEALEKFNPSVVLINTQLRQLSGLELALVIRQQERHSGLPLIFFAQQFDQTLRRVAMQGVGDDYLTEDVSDEQLIVSVLTRLRQAEQSGGRVHSPDNRDAFTGLFTRQHLLAELELVSKLSQEYPLAILFLSLDHYRGIDRILGLSASDAIIKHTAKFMAEQTGGDDILARFNDNSFVLLSQRRTLEQVRALAESLRSTLENHVTEISGERVLSTCSIGIALYHRSEQAAESHQGGAIRVLLDAEEACHEARARGGNRVQLHHSAENLKLDHKRRLYWEQVLKLALENDTFQLVYQPVTPLRSELHGYYDILLRLQGAPGKSAILPAEFLPVAGEVGLMPELDAWVIRHALPILADQYQANHSMRFFLRLSTASLKQGGLPARLKTWLADTPVPHEALIFDFTPEIAQDQLKTVETFVSEIRALGCSLALRDFDGGSLSLQLLKLLRPDYIKLHHSMIQSLPEHVGEMENLATVVEKAHAVNALVIAPFVENADSLSLLWRHEVDFIIGHFVQPPSERLEYEFATDL